MQIIFQDFIFLFCLLNIFPVDLLLITNEQKVRPLNGYVLGFIINTWNYGYNEESEWFEIFKGMFHLNLEK